MQFHHSCLFRHSLVRNLPGFIITALTYYFLVKCYLYINLAFLYFSSLGIQYILTKYL